MLKPTDVFEKNQQIPWRLVEGHAILVDQNEGEIVRLTSVGAAIWEALDGQTDVEGLVERLCEIFDASPERVRRDTVSFLKQLRRQDLIEPKGLE